MKVTIEHKEKQSEDIFTPGSLVVSTLDNMILLVNKGIPYNTDRFCGTVISEGKRHASGEHHNDWVQEFFTKFVGTITLEQE